MKISTNCLYFTLCIASMAITDLNAASGSCTHGCKCTGSSIECHYSMPDFIPPLVTNVTVHRASSLKEVFNFSDSSWENVTHLAINPDTSDLVSTHESIILVDNEFEVLKKLEYLQVACSCLKEIQTNAFHGLDKLTVLDLSNNIALNKESLVKALSGNDTLPNLQELHISNTSVVYLSIYASGKDLTNALRTKPIKVLDLSNTKDIWVGLTAELPLLETFNMSNSTVYLFFGFTTQGNNSLKLKSLDVSYVPYSAPLDTYPDWVRFTDLVRRLSTLKLNELYVKHFLRDPNRVYGMTNATHICISLRSTEASRKICYSVNLTTIEKLVISENKITYFEPVLWNGFSNLRHLDISSNDFGDAFKKAGYAAAMIENLRMVDELIMSDNNISVIPINTFERGNCIKFLDLSMNKLQSITFSTEHLDCLRKIDISQNRITVLDSTSSSRLTYLRNLHSYRNSSSEGAVIMLKGNPYVCSCETVYFLYYLVTFNETYTCGYLSEDKHIEKSFIQTVEYKCKESIVIIVFSVLFSVIMVLMAIMICLLLKERKRIKNRNVINKGIEIFQIHKDEMNFPPVFLSFSSDDDQLVMDQINPFLDAGLKKLLETDIRCVATSYNDFRPGFSVANEIIRCIEAANVAVFFVTNSFCEKVWCRNETLVAQQSNKPTVLIFWEEVDGEILPKHINKHINEYTCVKWVDEDGRRVMKPGWDKLCKTIVGLFAD